MKFPSLQRILHPRFVTLVIVLLIYTVLIWCLIRWTPQTVSRPLLSPTKDLLDIFSAIGQSFGVVALVGLIYEMYVYRREMRSRTTPRLKVQLFDIVDKLPAGALSLLSEDDESKLPRDGEHDYKYLWIAAKGHPEKHLVIAIQNEQTGFEGSARNFRLYVELIYSKTDKPNQSQADPKKLILPPSTLPGMTIGCGECVQLGVKLGYTDYPYLTVRVYDIACNNLGGDSFTGIKTGFLVKSLPTLQYNV